MRSSSLWMVSVLVASQLVGCSKSSNSPSAPPSTVAAVAGEGCYTPAQLNGQGTEISLSQFVDGSKGKYRLVNAKAMASYRTGDKTSSIGLAHLQVQPAEATAAVDTRVACKDFSQDSGNILSGNFQIPISIDRAGGGLTGQFEVAYNIGGSAADTKDSVETDGGDSFPVSSMQAFASAENSAGDSQLHLFQLSPTKFQMRLIGDSGAGDSEAKLVILADYVFEPAEAPTQPENPVVSATPVPPQPTPVPAPAMDEASRTRNAMAMTCRGYDDVDARVSCLKEVSTMALPPISVIPLCTGYDDVYARVSCFTDFAGKAVKVEVVEFCNTGEPAYLQEDCVKQLASKTLSPSQVEICSEYRQESQRVNCVTN